MIAFKVTNDPDQRFSTVINEQRVTLRLWYANFSDRWSMDVSIDGTPVLNGRRLVTGVNLLSEFGFDIGAIFAHSETDSVADRDSLFEGLVKIYHADESEINAAISS